MSENILYPLLLSLFAGLATLIGFFITLFAKRTNTKLLSFSLGLSAGVMVYISFVELLQEAFIRLKDVYGDKIGSFYAVLWFFGGMLVIAIIDRLVPSFENPHEIHSVEELSDGTKIDPKLKKTGVMMALAIGIHNFPEGMVTFMSSMENISLGIAIAFAIAIHNIPEGIAVSVPVYYATGSRKKAFIMTFVSGIAEPIGALVAYFILMPFLSSVLLGCVFAFIAGIMVFISFDELFPAAKAYGQHHLAIYGLISGMLIMAFSLILLV
ncbi:MAG: zinc transporter ZupT [Bacteroidetes bacterium]|nr:zinc transporter ZupT [Bacteroidota bacterium]